MEFILILNLQKCPSLWIEIRFIQWSQLIRLYNFKRWWKHCVVSKLIYKGKCSVNANTDEHMEHWAIICCSQGHTSQIYNKFMHIMIWVCMKAVEILMFHIRQPSWGNLPLHTYSSPISWNDSVKMMQTHIIIYEKQ